MLSFFVRVEMNLPRSLLERKEQLNYNVKDNQIGGTFFPGRLHEPMSMVQQMSMFRELLEENYDNDLAKCLLTLELAEKNGGTLIDTHTEHRDIVYKFRFQNFEDVSAFNGSFNDLVEEL